MNAKDEAWENYRTALGRYAEAYVRAGEVVADEVAARLRGAGSLLDEAVALIAAAAVAEARAPLVAALEELLRELRPLWRQFVADVNAAGESAPAGVALAFEHAAAALTAKETG